jgi:hypothetical protein
MARLSISLVKLDRATWEELPFMAGVSIPSGLKARFYAGGTPWLL